jgi:DNA-binding MarR family transcriptional regulator
MRHLRKMEEKNTIERIRNQTMRKGSGIITVRKKTELAQL